MSTTEIGYSSREVPGPPIGADREQRHVQLAREIELLESDLLVKAQLLLARVADGSVRRRDGGSPEQKEPRQDPSLAEVLRIGPDMIRETRARINDCLAELEGLLF